jgi:hypothetical protein
MFVRLVLRLVPLQNKRLKKENKCKCRMVAELIIGLIVYITLRDLNIKQYHVYPREDDLSVTHGKYFQ